MFIYWNVYCYYVPERSVSMNNEDIDPSILGALSKREKSNIARGLMRRHYYPFMLEEHFDRDNIVDIANSQFPRLELEYAIKRELETTRRFLIGIAAFCLIVGAAILILSPAEREGVSIIVASILAILPLGAIGVQEFRIKAIGMKIEAGSDAVKGNQ
jgi:hypothetical protein